MHCVRFEMRLNQLLDDRVSPDSDPDLVEHARECPDCGELFLGQEFLLQGIEAFDEPSAGPDLAVRVAAEAAAGSRRSRRRSWARFVPAVAAGLLLAFGVWHLLKGPAGLNPSPNNRITNTLPRTVPSVAPESTNPYHNFVVRTEEWRQQLGGQPLEWVDQMADGLKPVAESMSAAFHALRRTFPGGETPARSSQFEPLSLTRVAMVG
jgi:hypothetical protein